MHLVKIQPGHSTYYISDNATGGDCASIGTWTLATKTCQLTGNVNNTIYIQSSGVTLDGAGYTVTTPGWGYVQLAADHVTVKNLTIQGTPDCYCGYGIFMTSAPYSTVTNVTVTDMYLGIYLIQSSNAVIKDSVFPGQNYSYIHSSDNNTISNNTFPEVSTNNYGLYLYHTNNSTITGNTFSGFNYGVYVDGYSYSNDYWSQGYHYVDSQDYSSANNTVYRNNFLNTSVPIHLTNYYSPAITYSWDYRPDQDYYGSQTYDSTGNVGNVFNVAAPDGGNYYSQFDQPAEGCNDANSDGFCDAPLLRIRWCGRQPAADGADRRRCHRAHRERDTVTRRQRRRVEQ